MFAFLFIILLCLSLYISYYFNNKVYMQKRQIMVLKKQYEELKESCTAEDKALNTIVIKYRTPIYSKVKIMSFTYIHLSPLNDSPVLFTLNPETIINVIDMGEIHDTLWLEVFFPQEERINNKGWILESSICWITEDNLDTITDITTL